MEEGEKANSRAVEWFEQDKEVKEIIACVCHIWTTYLARKWISLGNTERNEARKLCYMHVFLITLRFFWRRTKQPFSA